MDSFSPELLSQKNIGNRRKDATLAALAMRGFLQAMLKSCSFINEDHGGFCVIRHV